jgi:hypothetical protein
LYLESEKTILLSLELSGEILSIKKNPWYTLNYENLI